MGRGRMKVISVVGYKNSGKTDLTVKLVKALKKKKKARVGTVKHIHERFDAEESDTFRHKEAGADVVIGVTPRELVRISGENNLNAALDVLADAGMDYAIVEGFKDSSIPKIAIGEVKARNIVKVVNEERDLDELVELIDGQGNWVTLNSLVKLMKRHKSIEKAGAIATFTGIVRGVDKGAKVKELQFEHCEEMAGKSIEKIRRALKQRDGIVDVLIHHRSGVIPAGDDIIYIVVGGAHRREVFKALSDAIEKVKREAPIWKKAVTDKGEYWVQEGE